MQYSVSPRVNFRSFGPKPSENVSTRTPMPPRRQEMPQLVHEDEHAEHEQKRKQGRQQAETSDRQF